MVATVLAVFAVLMVLAVFAGGLLLGLDLVIHGRGSFIGKRISDRRLKVALAKVAADRKAYIEEAAANSRPEHMRPQPELAASPTLKMSDIMNASFCLGCGHHFSHHNPCCEFGCSPRRCVPVIPTDAGALSAD